MATTKIKIPRNSTKLPKKSIAIGNSTSLRGRNIYQFGEVYVLRNIKKQKDKPWFLFYLTTGDYTGGFSNKQNAIKWYERGGR